MKETVRHKIEYRSWDDPETREASSVGDRLSYAQNSCSCGWKSQVWGPSENATYRADLEADYHLEAVGIMP